MGLRFEAGPARPTYLVDANGDPLIGASGLPISGTVGLLAGENHIGSVGGHTVQQAFSFNRPSDTTAYSANDAVTDSTSATTPLSWQLARTSGGGVTLKRFRLATNNASMAARLRLWLYRSSPASPPNDNALFQQSWGNVATRIGYVDFLTYVTGSGVTDYFGTFVLDNSVPVVPSAQTIYGILQTLDAFTPASGQTFNAYITAYQD